MSLRGSIGAASHINECEALRVGPVARIALDPGTVADAGHGPAESHGQRPEPDARLTVFGEVREALMKGTLSALLLDNGQVIPLPPDVP